MKKWICQKSELVFQDKFFRVKKDLIELPDGTTRDLVYWDSPDSVMIIGMLPNRRLIMEKQYRYLVGEEVIEFPAGHAEKGESLEETAKREFEEETRYRCGDLVELGSFYETYGQLNRKIHLFFTNQISGGRSIKLGEEEIEEIDAIVALPLDEVVKLAAENKIVASASALAILLLKEKINRGEIEL